MCEIRSLFPKHLQPHFADGGFLDGLEEIRVRIGQPVAFSYGGRNRYLLQTPQAFCDEADYANMEQRLYRATSDDLREMINYISNYSLYACKEEIRQGYITVEGGHRIGVAGQTAVADGKIVGISPITFLNIRIARERRGCAKPVLPYLKYRDSIYNTLILSMPGAGKTTLLRDLIRSLSSGEAFGSRMKVGVVDERSEIAALSRGVPQNDVGPCTDVLDGCSKAEGMRLLLRSMSPQVLAADELGGEEDFAAVEQALNCGSRVLCTIHAGNMEELAAKPYVKKWMERRLFERFVCLEKQPDGTRKVGVFDGNEEFLGC